MSEKLFTILELNNQEAIDNAIKHYGIHYDKVISSLNREIKLKYHIIAKMLKVQYSINDNMEAIISENEHNHQILSQRFGDIRNYIYQYYINYITIYSPELQTLMAPDTDDNQVITNLSSAFQSIYQQYLNAHEFITRADFHKNFIYNLTENEVLFNEDGSINENYIFRTNKNLDKKYKICAISNIWNIFREFIKTKKDNIDETINDFIDKIFDVRFMDRFYYKTHDKINKPVTTEELYQVISNKAFNIDFKYKNYLNDIIEFIKSSDKFTKALDNYINVDISVESIDNMYNVIKEHLYNKYQINEYISASDDIMFKYMKDHDLAFDKVGNVIQL